MNTCRNLIGAVGLAAVVQLLISGAGWASGSPASGAFNRVMVELARGGEVAQGTVRAEVRLHHPVGAVLQVGSTYQTEQNFEDSTLVAANYGDDPTMEGQEGTPERSQGSGTR